MSFYIGQIMFEKLLLEIVLSIGNVFRHCGVKLHNNLKASFNLELHNKVMNSNKRTFFISSKWSAIIVLPFQTMNSNLSEQVLEAMDNTIRLPRRQCPHSRMKYERHEDLTTHGLLDIGKHHHPFYLSSRSFINNL